MLFVTVIGYDINIAVAEYKVFEKQLEWSEYASMIIDQTYLTTLGYSMIVYDSMFFTLINCAVIQMIKVQYGLEHLDMTRDPYTEFCKLVKYHDFILRFITYINGIYSIQLLNHFFTTTCCICVGIFMLNVDGFPPSTDKLSYVSYLVCHNYQLYIYCSYGQILLNEMEAVGESLYNSDWYKKFQPKLRKAMSYVIIMSNLPNKLTIGGYWELNLKTYMSIVKTAFSFNAFVQNVFNKSK
nr:odorant receptor 4-like [Onthophagus taurus]